jgi:hypothetical protein
MGGGTAWIGDDFDVDGSTPSVVVIAAWRACNSNLVHRDVDVRQDDAIPISYQKKIKDLQ